MFVYDCARQYSKMKKEIEDNYGTVHLCGNCKHMTRCIREEIQFLDKKQYKKPLMEKVAPFVKKFEVEPLVTYYKDRGFIKVYECDRYEFEGVRGRRYEI